MEDSEIQKVTYCRVEIQIIRRGDRLTGYCPFCDFAKDVEAGFYPKFSVKLAAGWIQHHLEVFHPALLG
jgi:hypothetical protein